MNDLGPIPNVPLYSLYLLYASPFQMLQPLSTKYLMLVSPFKNHFSSVIIVLTAIFFVVSRGNPLHIQCVICLPNTEMVPVPVRSDFSTPFCRMSINRAWYCVSNPFITKIQIL